MRSKQGKPAACTLRSFPIGGPIRANGAHGRSRMLFGIVEDAPIPRRQGPVDRVGVVGRHGHDRRGVDRVERGRERLGSGGGAIPSRKRRAGSRQVRERQGGAAATVLDASGDGRCFVEGDRGRRLRAFQAPQGVPAGLVAIGTRREGGCSCSGGGGGGEKGGRGCGGDCSCGG